MRLIVNDGYIQATTVIDGQRGVAGVMCDALTIGLPMLPTQAQIADLIDGIVQTDDGREYKGYTGVAEWQVTLYRQPQDAQQRAMQEMTANVERMQEEVRKAQNEKTAAEAAREAAETSMAEAQRAQAEAETQRAQAEDRAAQAEAARASLEAQLAAQQARDGAVNE